VRLTFSDGQRLTAIIDGCGSAYWPLPSGVSAATFSL
jgi:hypothetical protein